MKAGRSSSIAVRLAIVALMSILLATAAPATAAVISEASTGSVGAKFSSSLEPKPPAAEKIAKVLIVQSPAEATPEEPVQSAVRVEQVVAQPSDESATPTTKAQAPVVAAAPKPAAAAPGTTVSRTDAATGELAQAKAILARYIAQYPILQGTTVTIGETPGGYQAVCYYQSGRILISPNHTASLETIIAHEVWHVIDWRDNGRIDWGENIPPK